VNAGRSDQRERGEPGGIAHGDLGGDPTTQRATHEVNPTQVELIEKIEIEIREVGNVVEPIRRIGGAESGMLGSDDVECLCQSCHRGQPDSDATAAVQEQQRRPATATHEADAASPDRDHLVGMIGHFTLFLEFASYWASMLT
jgi:hypothetical protein